MSFLSALCGCFARDEKPSQHHSSPEMSQRSNPAGFQTGHFTLSGEGKFIRSAPQTGGHGHGPPPSDSEDAGYSSVAPLPQYTARPMSLHEKTLEAHMRDPSISSESQNSYPQDEKSANRYDEDVTSDSSSAISFPSSYGNTSTATRETPPPPYSPRHSSVLCRSRSISISSAMAVIINPPPAARMNGSRTGPTYSEDDRSIRRHRRVSWESR
ncbi:hypothetical protein N7489_006331 [Penicillium chrysogenum]|jgi:hypothetical protein|uniref:Uncharacterized protein n=1 Tax=Penicillium chrysogenum TaxID=5076 RepID=A0ABQ8W377_PENCH|nr:uncharacterized protein N7489_006331 [Penicillium chrysogenum]KAJ5236240.1 hypothetical protein N7489_006331 [Penicillium chrysogenum]KAJ5255144.1 hypothetical protein N7505_010295 [Penicillium chrysogenum]KAJ5276179.1 hypothetical protein N7524_002332 [Penicillium chrysogenum]KAJ6153058.1 hypothetical protein N7497_007377 [Penicillium chrysogenum]